MIGMIETERQKKMSFVRAVRVCLMNGLLHKLSAEKLKMQLMQHVFLHVHTNFLKLLCHQTFALLST